MFEVAAMTAGNGNRSGPRPAGRGAAVAASRRKAARRRDTERRLVALGAATVAVLVAVALIINSRSDRSAGAAAPVGTRSYGGLSRTHTTSPVRYPQTPPVGGDHNPVWANCGFYPQPIPAEKGVHSMEHGAVWITYRPDLAPNQISSLSDLARGTTYMLVSPWADGLPSPVVASAWGKQLALPSADDPKLAEFVRAFRAGPQTPEPGAACTGGDRGMG
jgi:hypothetical protein